MTDFGGACGAKFSTTPLVFGEKHLLIRWSAYTLGVQVKREGSLTRTHPPPPPPSRHDAPRVAGTSRWLYFCCLGKTSLCVCVQFCLSGSLSDCGLLNRLERVRRLTFVRVRVSRAALYIAVRRVAQNISNSSRFCHASCLAPPP